MGIALRQRRIVSLMRSYKNTLCVVMCTHARMKGIVNDRARRENSAMQDSLFYDRLVYTKMAGKSSDFMVY